MKGSVVKQVSETKQVVRSYRDLKIWQQSKQLAVKVLTLTESFPQNKRFSLGAQMDKSAISVPSNIAEGNGRNNTKEYIQFLGIAQGSLLELETQMIIANDIKLITDNNVAQMLAQTSEIGRMIYGLQQKLRNT